MKRIYTVTLVCMALLGISLSSLAQNVNGNGKLVTQTRSVSAFKTLKVTGGFEVVLTQGTTESLKLEADENVLQHINTDVKDGVLHIHTKGIKNANKLKAYITVRDLENLQLSGGIKLTSSNTIKGDKLNVEFSGGISVVLALDVDVLNGEIAGGTSTEFTGRANKARIEMAGASSLKAVGLATNYFTLEAAGVGNAELNVNKELSVETAGIFNVEYKGNATVRHSGMGKVKRM